MEDLYPYACVVANATEAYGVPAAWGWADTDCTVPRLFMCRNASEWRGALCRACRKQRMLAPALCAANYSALDAMRMCPTPLVQATRWSATLRQTPSAPTPSMPSP